MIRLTRNDWVEIYYALDTKLLALRQGNYSPEDILGQDDAWLVHLEKIKKKIGVDGSACANKGVASVKRPGNRD
jgi:hypothetical protein